MGNLKSILPFLICVIAACGNSEQKSSGILATTTSTLSDAATVMFDDSLTALGIDNVQFAIEEMVLMLRQAPTCPAGARKIGPTCIETLSRPAVDYNSASHECLAAGGELCDAEHLAFFCSETSSNGFNRQPEWSKGSHFDTFSDPEQWRTTVMFNIDGDCSARHSQLGVFSDPLPANDFRCCFPTVGQR